MTSPVTNDATAQSKGFEDYHRSCKAGDTSAFGRSDYDPPAGFGPAYDIGWNEAARQYDATFFKHEHRGTCVVQIVVGLLFLGFGLVVTFGTARDGGDVIIFAYGALFTGLGLAGRGVYGLFTGRAAPEPTPPNETAA